MLCMWYCVMSPFGDSGELHATRREVAVAVERITLPTPVGAAEIRNSNEYRMNGYIKATHEYDNNMLVKMQASHHSRQC